jgi:hypothetical protein
VLRVVALLVAIGSLPCAADQGAQLVLAGIADFFGATGDRRAG